MDNQPVASGGDGLPEEVILGQREPEVQLASFSERFLAYFIDAMPFLVLCYATLYYAVQKLGAVYSQSLDLKWRLGWMLVYLCYMAVFSCGGMVTLGKFIMGIRVRRREDGLPLGFLPSCVRAFGYILSAVILNIGFLMALFTSEKRALHDYMAGSMVIRVREKGLFVQGIMIAFAWALLALLGAAWYMENFRKPTPEDEKLVAMAKWELRRIAYLEELHQKRFGYYTNDFKKLFYISGNPAAFKRELDRTLMPEGLELGVDSANHFYISASARDKFKTRVQFSNRKPE